MVGRRKPLVLSSSTKSLISSILLNSSNKQTEDGDPAVLQLHAGILRLSEDKLGISLDDAALIGLSTSPLKKLFITSASLVIVKNVDCHIQRVSQVVTLNPPNVNDVSSKNKMKRFYTIFQMQWLCFL